MEPIIMSPELTEEQINEAFCKEIGLKKACCYLHNEETDEIRFYAHPSGLYKKPKNWKHITKGKFEPCYPDFINNSYNFCILLNLQWFLFGELGGVYKRNGNESFQANYLKTRLSALKLCKSLGGGEMLEEYKKQVSMLPFDYLKESNDSPICE